ncbi:MAG: hypothetical protein IPO63_18400 [Bacteroidetes bacterium]|nr:hypothetical protein [Bacteroidota bacterium]
MEVTVKNLTGKNAQAHSAFDEQMRNDRAKTEPSFNKAQVVKKQCERSSTNT